MEIYVQNGTLFYVIIPTSVQNMMKFISKIMIIEMKSLDGFTILYLYHWWNEHVPFVVANLGFDYHWWNKHVPFVVANLDFD